MKGLWKMKDKYEKMLILVVVFAVGLAVSMANADIVAHWNLDDSDGGMAHDSLGSGDGILKGNPEWAKGRFGGALKFDGDGDYVDCGGGKNLGNLNTWADITDTMTVAAWIKVNKFDKQWQAIVTKGDSAWRLARTDNEKTLAFHLTGVTSDNNGTHMNLGVEGNVNVEDGQWHHAVGVYDGLKVYLYVDGILDKLLDASGTIATNNHKVCIGENIEQRGRYFNGLIDGVAIFDHALTEDEVKQLYAQSGESFVPPTLLKLVNELQKARSIAGKQGPQKAIVFLEKKIAEYELWKENNPNHIKLTHKGLSSELYFLLAKAKEAAGAPTKDFVAAYKHSISRLLYRRNYVPALLWLFKNTSAIEYADAIKKSMRNSNGTSANLHRIARDFESSKNWDAFKLFCDAIFSKANDSTSFAKAIAAGLRKEGLWADNFSRYARSKPQLTQYIIEICEKLAQENIAQNKFLKAAEIYRDIVNQCGPEQDKTTYELKVCECIFESGEYDRVLSELNDFINNNKSVNEDLVTKAMLLKGQVYLQLSEIDRAYNIFSKLMREYPKTERALEASFFIGYCNMLQSKYKEAVEALNRVVRDCPQDSYVNKARLCLARIKRVTE